MAGGNYEHMCKCPQVHPMLNRWIPSVKFTPVCEIIFKHREVKEVYCLYAKGLQQPGSDTAQVPALG
jgi:hypothetical protein